MDDVFELLSKQNVYVKGVRLIPVGFKTKLNTFFDIAVVWKRKRGNEGGSRLHFCNSKYEMWHQYSGGLCVVRLV